MIDPHPLHQGMIARTTLSEINRFVKFNIRTRFELGSLTQN